MTAAKHRRGPRGGALCGASNWRVLARKNEPATCQRCVAAERTASTRSNKEGQPHVLGYARVSRLDQNVAAQVAQLEAAGCGRIYQEHVSGVGARLQWARLVEDARPGDIVVVVRLDRIGRRMAEVVKSVQELHDRGVAVRSIAQGIDTGAPGGKLLVGLFAALAETELEILKERTREGLAAARAKGRHCGRPRRVTPAVTEQIRHLRAKGYSISEIADATKLGRATVARELAKDLPRDQRQLTIPGA